jgi:soluble lytic murein transglycosylase
VSTVAAPRTRALALALLMANATWGREVAAEPPAEGEAAADEAKVDEAAAKALLVPRTRSAGRSTLLDGSAAPYAEARRLLSRGQPQAALAALDGSRSTLFADREALIRADALLALGDKAGARAAYRAALEQSQLRAVSLAAARGLVNVLGQLRQHEGQLELLDALLADPELKKRAALVLQKAELLRLLGRYQDAAQLAWRVVQEHPADPAAVSAERMLSGFAQRKVKLPVTSDRLELARIGNLIQAREYGRAESALKALEKRRPQLAKAITFKRAELYKKQRKKSEERTILERLEKEGVDPDDEADVLYRLGELAMNRGDNALAVQYFDRVAERHPQSAIAREAEYFAGWIPYNEADYERASERLFAFAERHPAAPRRVEALWYSGWSAYLGKKDDAARRAFERLAAEHGGSELRLFALYWLGRLEQRAGQADQARLRYRAVLAQSPLGYYGFWARARLGQLGTPVPAPEPPAKLPPPATVAAAVKLLGPNRPIGIDRAILLHQADLDDLALEELSAAERSLRTVRDVRGRTAIADMLAELGAHHLAYVTGIGITSDGGELSTGEPSAWRAWRHAFPRAFPTQVKQAGEAHAVAESLILSIMRTESSFRPEVRSPVGARGLMQVMPGTAKQIGSRDKAARRHAARFQQPESNVWLGAWYLKEMLARYSGQLAGAIGAYNAGPGAMDRWLEKFGGLELDEFVERVPYKETRRYIRKVLEAYMVYQKLEGAPLPELLTTMEARQVPEGAVSF